MKVLSLMVGPIMTNCYILCDEEIHRILYIIVYI